MYLYIFEDGEVMKAATFGDDDKNSCDMGILDVIDISLEDPKTYYEGEWVDIESADTINGE